MKIIQRILRKLRKDKKQQTKPTSYLLKDWFNQKESATEELFRAAMAGIPAVSVASL